MLLDNKTNAFILGASLFFGLSTLGYLLGNAAIQFKQYDRSVTVKGLSEQEYNANVVIWPIEFSTAASDLDHLYQLIDANTSKIKNVLNQNGISEQEVTFEPPAINDKSFHQYSNNPRPEFRYTALQTITVYSKNVDTVRSAINKMSALGKQGIVFSSNNYESKIEYIFTNLNEVKPPMIEEATRQAREVAVKFAMDSQSELGKIKKASQGQFSISARDKNNPHIKKVRVVSTVQYYLSD